MSTDERRLPVEAPSTGTEHRTDRPDDTVEQLDAPPQRSTADRVARRVLRLPVDDRQGTADEARKAFQTSLLVATVRCLLMYIFFPFVLPALGIARGVGPAIGLAISVAAVIAIVMSIRRFFRADHSKRWHYTALGVTVIAFLAYTAVVDVAELLG